ncbi:MAG: hypothetical protein H0V61_09435 [Chitinophagales bacterium]|jgi:hypothetical protein|nr:hypothetical protein [Chitinophagales bacterium]
MKRLMILTTLLLGISLAVLAVYFINQPVSSLNGTKPDFALSSAALYGKFVQNEDSANKQYLGKIVELSGKVKDYGADENGQMSLILEGDELFGVNCKLNSSGKDVTPKIQKGDQVKVKGVCSGKLMDVILVNCSVEQG